MNSKQIQRFIRIARKLDLDGEYKKSDLIFVRLAQYYPEQSLTKVPMVQYVEFDDNSVLQDEITENEQNYRKKKPNLVVKEYYDLGGEADGENLEGLLNGPDSVPGPAYIDPGNLASSPSMAGDVDGFSYEETYQKNVDEGNSWKNRIPIR
jgi:hypothetical protein